MIAFYPVAETSCLLKLYGNTLPAPQNLQWTGDLGYKSELV
jgi:hypothetical protein